MKIDKKTIIINAIVIFFTFAFSWVINSGFFNPYNFSGEEKSKDFELSDLYASVGNHSAVHQKSKDIVVVSSDRCSRKQIAAIIESADLMGAKVIGLDHYFDVKQDGDERLISAIEECENAILPIIVQRNMENGIFEIKDSSYFYNIIDDGKFGAINLAGNSPRSVIREFSPSFKTYNETLDNFVSAVVKCYAPEKYDFLLERDHELERIHYHATDYNIIQWNEIITLDSIPQPMLDLEKEFDGKIVLIGHIHNDNDIHLTPISDETPGILIHAAAINTILNSNYIKTSSTFFNYFIAIILSVLCVSIMSYAKKHLNNTGIFIIRITQLTLLLLMFAIGTLIYLSYDTYVDFSLSLLMIGLSALFFDIIYGVYGIAVLIYNKYNKKK